MTTVTPNFFITWSENFAKCNSLVETQITLVGFFKAVGSVFEGENIYDALFNERKDFDVDDIKNKISEYLSDIDVETKRILVSNISLDAKTSIVINIIAHILLAFARYQNTNDMLICLERVKGKIIGINDYITEHNI